MAEKWYQGKLRNKRVKKNPLGEKELAGEVRITDAYSRKSVKKNNLKGGSKNG